MWAFQTRCTLVEELTLVSDKHLKVTGKFSSYLSFICSSRSLVDETWQKTQRRCCGMAVSVVKKLSLIRNVILKHIWRLPIQTISACCFWRIHKKRRLAKKGQTGPDWWPQTFLPFLHKCPLKDHFYCISTLLYSLQGRETKL